MLSNVFHSCPFWKSFLDNNPSRLFCQWSMQRQGLSVLWLFSELKTLIGKWHLQEDTQLAGNKWHSSTNPTACLSRRFSRMRSNRSRFTLGVWGLRRVCSLDVAFTTATVRNRPQPSATVCNHPQPFATVCVRAVWPCLWRVLQKRSLLEVSKVA